MAAPYAGMPGNRIFQSRPGTHVHIIGFEVTKRGTLRPLPRTVSRASCPSVAAKAWSGIIIVTGNGRQQSCQCKEVICRCQNIFSYGCGSDTYRPYPVMIDAMAAPFGLQPIMFFGGASDGLQQSHQRVAE